MQNVHTRRYTGEFKALAIALGESVGLAKAARQLDMSVTTLDNRNHPANSPCGGLTLRRTAEVVSAEQNVSLYTGIRSQIQVIHEGTLSDFLSRESGAASAISHGHQEAKPL